MCFIFISRRKWPVLFLAIMQHLVKWSPLGLIESWLLIVRQYDTKRSFIIAQLYSLFLCVLCLTLFVKRCVCQCLIKNYLTWLLELVMVTTGSLRRCNFPVKSPPPAHQQHSVLHTWCALPVSEPTVSGHLRKLARTNDNENEMKIQCQHTSHMFIQRRSKEKCLAFHDKNTVQTIQYYEKWAWKES